MNSNYSKTPFKHSFVLNLAYKTDLRRDEKYVALSNFGIYYTWNRIGKPYRINKLKISGRTLAKEFELLGRSYSISDTQNYFEYIIKKYEPLTNSLLFKIYIT